MVDSFSSRSSHASEKFSPWRSIVLSCACLGLASGALLLSDCSIVLKTDSEQCSKDSDCTSRGTDFANTHCSEHVCQDNPDTAWSCVGHVTRPVAGPNFTSSLSIKDLISGKAPTGSVKLCHKYDPACTGPILDVSIPPDGLLTTQIEPTFTGFYKIESEIDRPTLYFVDTGASSEVKPVALLSQAASDALNVVFDPRPDIDAGSLSISMLDCNLQRASGVHFDIDAPKSSLPLPYYVVAGAVTTSATATDVGGSGGFANLAEDSVTITATLEKTGQVVARVVTLIRTGSLTYQPLRPTPL